MTDRLAQLHKLYEIDPNDPFVPYGIALEHAKSGAYDEALRWLETTLELDAGYAYAWYQKGRILAEAGRPKEARTALTEGMAKAREIGTAETRHAAEEMQALIESIGD